MEEEEEGEEVGRPAGALGPPSMPVSIEALPPEPISRISILRLSFSWAEYEGSANTASTREFTMGKYSLLRR